MTRLEFIPSQCIKINQDQRDDLAQWVICGIHIAEGSSAGVARAWKVNVDNTDAGEIIIPSEGGKDDTVACKVLPDGGVRFVVSEAEAPGASGSTARPFAYVVPNVFAPVSSIVAEGNYVAAPGGVPQIARSGFGGQEVIDLDPYGIPLGVQLHIRLSVQAAAPWRFARVGTPGDPLGRLFHLVTQAAGVRMVGYDHVAASADNTLLLMADQGQLDSVVVDILGWWY